MALLPVLFALWASLPHEDLEIMNLYCIRSIYLNFLSCLLVLVLIFLFTIIKIKFIKKKDLVVGGFGLQ